MDRLKSKKGGPGMVLRIYTLGGAPELRAARARSNFEEKTLAPAAGGRSKRSRRRESQLSLLL